MARHPVIAIDEDEWVTIAWRGQREKCCDCGMVHELDFQVVDGKLQFRGRRLKDGRIK